VHNRTVLTRAVKTFILAFTSAEQFDGKRRDASKATLKASTDTIWQFVLRRAPMASAQNLSSRLPVDFF